MIDVATIRQFLDDPRELGEDVMLGMEEPIVRAIIASGLAMENGFSEDVEEWLSFGLMNDFTYGNAPAGAAERIIAHLKAS